PTVAPMPVSESEIEEKSYAPAPAAEAAFVPGPSARSRPDFPVAVLFQRRQCVGAGRIERRTSLGLCRSHLEGRVPHVGDGWPVVQQLSLGQRRGAPQSPPGWPGPQFWTAEWGNPTDLGPVQWILHRNSQPLAALLCRDDLPTRGKAGRRRRPYCRSIGPAQFERVQFQHQFLNAGPGYGERSLVPDGDDACQR